jgi:hypothetical protein
MPQVIRYRASQGKIIRGFRGMQTRATLSTYCIYLLIVFQLPAFISYRCNRLEISGIHPGASAKLIFAPHNFTWFLPAFFAS